MKISQEVREIEKHINALSGDKNEQIAIISKAQGMVSGHFNADQHVLAAMIIAKNRIIRQMKATK